MVGKTQLKMQMLFHTSKRVQMRVQQMQIVEMLHPFRLPLKEEDAPNETSSSVGILPYAKS